MSHIIVEIPKDAPSKGFWVELVAENWIKDEILYLPGNRYSKAYKQHLLVGGEEPEIDTWESYPWFKVVHSLGKFYLIYCY